MQAQMIYSSKSRQTRLFILVSDIQRRAFPVSDPIGKEKWDTAIHYLAKLKNMVKNYAVRQIPYLGLES